MNLPNDFDYHLLDSGNGEKLEQFGNVVVRRPSSVCIWKPRVESLWEKATANYHPDSGWKGSKDLVWQANIADCELKLRLQDNGQVGLFPEHASYLPQLSQSLADNSSFKVLNLFAFTGLATLFFRKRGAQVTHVDLSKKVLGWAKENIELQNSNRSNSTTLPDVRWICEDAIAYLKREVRRASQYDGIIVDPPSFSRITKNDFWKVADILQELVADCSALLKQNGKFLALTCHDPGISAPMLANLLHDHFKAGKVTPIELSISEKESPRLLPAGSCALWQNV